MTSALIVQLGIIVLSLSGIGASVLYTDHKFKKARK